MRLSFNTTHELGVFAFLSLFGLIIWLHPNPLPDFSIYAQRGAATRIWHETVPPVPEEIKALEERLQRDLEKLERDGREKAGVGLKEQMPWNKEIWQSWKNEELGEWRDTWKNHNPDWKYRLVLDSQADTLIRSTYAQVPDVLEIWNALKRPVLKADLFRYLVIYAYGGAVPALLIGHQKYGLIEVGWSGLYTDVDTTSIIPLDQWMTEEQWEDPNTHSVIALSAVGFADAFMELVQWTFLARPYSPLIRTALVSSITNIRRQAHSQNAEALTDVHWDFQTVLKATGPVAFTEMCVRSIRKETHGTIKEPFFWGLVYDQKKPIQVGGTVVLPIKGGWRGHGGGGPDEYFRHHNQASWVGGIEKPYEEKGE